MVYVLHFLRYALIVALAWFACNTAWGQPPMPVSHPASLRFPDLPEDHWLNDKVDRYIPVPRLFEPGHRPILDLTSPGCGPIASAGIRG
ncbi:MAG: hypothetical protein ACPGU7_01070 [Gammaproteobacteria bacterium]